MVGLIPLYAVDTLEPELLDKVLQLKRRLDWFLNYREDLASLVSRWQEPGLGDRGFCRYCAATSCRCCSGACWMRLSSSKPTFPICRMLKAYLAPFRRARQGSEGSNQPPRSQNRLSDAYALRFVSVRRLSVDHGTHLTGRVVVVHCSRCSYRV
jgi:hypothetical protein